MLFRCFLSYLEDLTNKSCKLVSLYFVVTLPESTLSTLFSKSNFSPKIWQNLPHLVVNFEFWRKNPWKSWNWFFGQKQSFCNSVRPIQGNKVWVWNCNAFSSFAQVLIIKKKCIIPNELEKMQNTTFTTLFKVAYSWWLMSERFGDIVHFVKPSRWAICSKTCWTHQFYSADWC